MLLTRTTGWAEKAYRTPVRHVGDVNNPKAPDAVPITAFYSDRVPFVIPRDICGVVDPHHDLVPFVHVRQPLGKCV